MGIAYASWLIVVHQCLTRLVRINAIFFCFFNDSAPCRRRTRLVQMPSFSALNDPGLRRRT